MQPSYRWVIVGVGARMTCVAVGAMFSLAVFFGTAYGGVMPREQLQPA